MEQSHTEMNPLEQGFPTILVFYDQFGILRIGTNTQLAPQEMLSMLTLAQNMSLGVAMQEIGMREQQRQQGKLGNGILVPDSRLVVPQR